jgi:hypothetical protein
MQQVRFVAAVGHRKTLRQQLVRICFPPRETANERWRSVTDSSLIGCHRAAADAGTLLPARLRSSAVATWTLHGRTDFAWRPLDSSTSTVVVYKTSAIGQLANE